MPKGKSILEGLALAVKCSGLEVTAIIFHWIEIDTCFIQLEGARKCNSTLGPEKLRDGGGIQNFLAKSPEDLHTFLASYSFYIFTDKN